MKTRMLGYTKVSLTTIGLGTWAHGGGGWNFSWGPQDDNESIRTIHKAWDLGVNWVDTAAVYGLGHAEEVVGKALNEMPVKPFVATKCGLVWNRERTVRGNLSKQSILTECEASLRRLNLETIDLYQIHWPMPDEQIEEGWGAIAKLVKEGKIRYAGVSNFSVDQMQRAQAIHPIASLQPPYSMLERGAEKELLSFCNEHEIGVIVYSPLQKGLLTGKITAEYVAAMAKDDHRKSDLMFQNPQLSSTLKKVEALKKIAEEKKITVAQLAIAWVLRRPEVTAAIVGGRTPAQIEGTAPAMEITLSDFEMASIEKILAP